MKRFHVLSFLIATFLIHFDAIQLSATTYTPQQIEQAIWERSITHEQKEFLHEALARGFKHIRSMIIRSHNELKDEYEYFNRQESLKSLLFAHLRLLDESLLLEDQPKIFDTSFDTKKYESKFFTLCTPEEFKNLSLEDKRERLFTIVRKCPTEWRKEYIQKNSSGFIANILQDKGVIITINKSFLKPTKVIKKTDTEVKLANLFTNLDQLRQKLTNLSDQLTQLKDNFAIASTTTSKSVDENETKDSSTSESTHDEKTTEEREKKSPFNDIHPSQGNLKDPRRGRVRGQTGRAKPSAKNSRKKSNSVVQLEKYVEGKNRKWFGQKNLLDRYKKTLEILENDKISNKLKPFSLIIQKIENVMGQELPEDIAKIPKDDLKEEIRVLEDELKQDQAVIDCFKVILIIKESDKPESEKKEDLRQYKNYIADAGLSLDGLLAMDAAQFKTIINGLG